MKRPVLYLTVGMVWLLGSSVTAPSPSAPVVDEHPAVGLTNVSITPCYQELTGGGFSVQVSILGGAIGCYGAEIREAADRYGVDPRLVYAVIEVESAFHPWAVSPKGAKGLMQLMPETSSVLGIRDSFNPRQNIHGGVRHLRGLIVRYRGDLRLALAAYHAGHWVVDRYRRMPPYPETHHYVQKILLLYGDSLLCRYPPYPALMTSTNVNPLGHP